MKAATFPASTRHLDTQAHDHFRPFAALRRMVSKLMTENDRTFPAIALAEAGDTEGAAELLTGKRQGLQ